MKKVIFKLATKCVPELEIDNPTIVTSWPKNINRFKLIGRIFNITYNSLFPILSDIINEGRNRCIGLCVSYIDLTKTSELEFDIEGGIYSEWDETIKIIADPSDNYDTLTEIENIKILNERDSVKIRMLL